MPSGAGTASAAAEVRVLGGKQQLWTLPLWRPFDWCGKRTYALGTACNVELLRVGVGVNGERRCASFGGKSGSV